MIITRTPYRISFFGGGTDYPGWYKNHGGHVLSTTIDKYLYITCRTLPPFFEYKLRLVYSTIEKCNKASELDHPSAREVLKFLKIKDGLEIHYDGDLPGRSGSGSSSAFTVGLLHALYAHRGQTITAKELAETSIHIEQNLIKETVGSQDQTNAAYGGFNHIKFQKNGEIEVNPVNISSEVMSDLQNNLLLFYTGIQRTAEKIARSYVENIEDRSKILNMMSSMVDQALDRLMNNDIDGFGNLLDETWKQKRSLSTLVSNPIIDSMYQEAIDNGALGGKLSGAGGGGILLLYVPLEKQKQVKKKLSKLLHIPFNFETHGSQIIHSS